MGCATREKNGLSVRWTAVGVEMVCVARSGARRNLVPRIASSHVETASAPATKQPNHVHLTAVGVGMECAAIERWIWGTAMGIVPRPAGTGSAWETRLLNLAPMIAVVSPFANPSGSVDPTVLRANSSVEPVPPQRSVWSTPVASPIRARTSSAVQTAVAVRVAIARREPSVSTGTARTRTVSPIARTINVAPTAVAGCAAGAMTGSFVPPTVVFKMPV